MSASKPTYHYYEGHVTTEPVFEDRLKTFTELCLSEKFHVAKLLLQKRKEDTEERSKKDAFCTSRDEDYGALEGRMLSLAQKLRVGGFKVWRVKIESVLLDSRYDETLQLLIDKKESDEP